MASYQEFAALYDRLMDDVDYDAWAQHYIRLLHLTPKDKVAEMGCGTGSVSVRLAKAGIQLLATDLSPEMIAVAQQKARACGAQLQFAVQDMTRFAVPRRMEKTSRWLWSSRRDLTRRITSNGRGGLNPRAAT